MVSLMSAVDDAYARYGRLIGILDRAADLNQLGKGGNRTDTEGNGPKRRTKKQTTSCDTGRHGAPKVGTPRSPAFRGTVLGEIGDEGRAILRLCARLVCAQNENNFRSRRYRFYVDRNVLLCRFSLWFIDFSACFPNRLDRPSHCRRLKLT